MARILYDRGKYERLPALVHEGAVSRTEQHLSPQQIWKYRIMKGSKEEALDYYTRATKAIPPTQ